MKFFYGLIVFSFIIASCSKSSDNEVKPQPIIVDIPKPLDSLEKHFGIKISDKEDLTYTNHFINDDSTILSISAEKDGVSWSVTYDIHTRDILFDHAFPDDPDHINVGYGESLKVEKSWLEIRAKTNTHLYGERVFQSLTNMSVFRSFIVSEIKSNKIIDSDLTKSSSHMVRPWFDNTVFFVIDNSLDYMILGDDNKTLIEGSFEYSNHIKGTAVSMSITLDFISSFPTGFMVRSLDRSFGSIILFNPRVNNDDRVQVKSISSQENIATIVFIITSFENKVTEKTVKVDFENQEIVSVYP